MRLSIPYIMFLSCSENHEKIFSLFLITQCGNSEAGENTNKTVIIIFYIPELQQEFKIRYSLIF